MCVHFSGPVSWTSLFAVTRCVLRPLEIGHGRMFWKMNSVSSLAVDWTERVTLEQQFR